MNVVLALTLAAALQDADVQAAPIESYLLSNGVQVTVAHATTATSQAMLTVLPMGLLSDEPGHAQWSHLLEHVMLRASHPEHRVHQIDGTVINGETTALALRLETFAPVDDWRAAQRRHVEFLNAGEVDPDGLESMLQREKSAVLQEVDATSRQGFTHKWAVAAWNQVVRHGLGHARVRGDVADATLPGVLEAISRKVRLGKDVHLISVGPVDPGELLAALEEDFGGGSGEAWEPVRASVDPALLRAPVDRVASWDLPVRHYLEWYPMPDRYARDRIAADALALMLNVRLAQHGSLQGLGVQAMAQADIVTPEGRWLLISASLLPETDLARAREEIDSVVANLTPAPDVRLNLGNMVTQLLAWPDFAALREQYSGNPRLEFVEAQQVLFQVYAMQNMGLDREQLAAYGAFDRQAFEDFVAEVMLPEVRATLLLEPGDG